MTTSQPIRELPTEYAQHPRELYRRLRADGPVHHVRMPNGIVGWLVTDYELARQALADPVLSKDTAGMRATMNKFPGVRAAVHDELTEHMLNTDPPDHTRLRKLVNRAFTARAVGRWEPRIEAIAADLLDAMATGPDEVDLLDAYAFPLPMTVICEMLGVPVDDQERFRGWSNVIVSGGTSGTGELTEVAGQMSAYILELIERKRADPGEDLLSDLLTASEDGDRLSGNELLSMVFLLLVAGHETTVNLIGNGMLALLRHPDQLARLRADPELLPAAIEEVLRYDGPVNVATLRYTSEPWTVAGTTIDRHEVVLVPLLAANHDPARFPDPDTFDISRDAGRHLAFGHGPHFCVGAGLARLEARIAIRALLDRFPRLDLAAEPAQLRWRNGNLIHGLVDLPVRLGPPR